MRTDPLGLKVVRVPASVKMVGPAVSLYALQYNHERVVKCYRSRENAANNNSVRALLRYNSHYADRRHFQQQVPPVNAKTERLAEPFCRQE